MRLRRRQREERGFRYSAWDGSQRGFDLDADALLDMMQRLRERRKEMLEQYDLGGVYEDIAERLREIVDQEREGIEERVDDAQRGGDQRQQEIVEEVAEQRRQQLNEMPPDLAGKVQSLQDYEWMSDD